MMKKYILLLVLLVQLAEIQAQTPEQRLEELGISLSEPGEPVGTYVNWRRVGNLVYIAGVGASVFGKVGKDLTIKEGYEAARLTGVQVISILKEAVGDLTKIKQFVRVHGMVNSSPDFYQQPKVINGFSDLMVKIFGEKGRHARAAVGQVALPFNIAVEIEVTVELEDEN
jgi:enamine deaminase RidA (YjgF/YER057c/UK114 family)|tara:strand:- start:279 stop:788 length:510 start_codon:yes stop_codon:yes gene_type:complete